MKKEDLMILQKTYDMTHYAYGALRQFPKSERYALAADIKSSMHQLLQLIIRANKKFHKKTTLQDADIEIDVLRHFIRLSMELEFLTFKKYEYWSKLINEIGKMMGGWIKATTK